MASTEGTGDVAVVGVWPLWSWWTPGGYSRTGPLLPSGQWLEYYEGVVKCGHWLDGLVF